MKTKAAALGFDLCGIAPAVTPPGYPSFLEWLHRGHAGEMHYLPNRREAYEHPRHVLPDVKSVIMVALNYRTEEPQPTAPGQGRVARYAWGEADYHDVIKSRLKKLANVLHDAVPGCHTRPIVDTAPLLERDFARLAGLGWFGKNTVLINKWKGSYLFLGALLTDIELPVDQPHLSGHCGTCTRCLEACPTDALVGPYELDARKCISYLTIELKAEIPIELRDGIGDWMFGCDICQEVCPWNRDGARAIHQPEDERKRLSRSGEFEPKDDLNPADCVELLRMAPDEFRKRFKKSPLNRPKRAGLLRNAAIVLGNTGERSHLAALEHATSDEEPLIREAAAWAIERIQSRIANPCSPDREGGDDVKATQP
ncbi:Epoxyqueuosine reductase [Stratiformator vulcanicus]|uniref:Epoxyqueuosine reductase n=2 Tax=Stratiformator vulcanicus TaxID=2527980 RepID=A0A517R5R9_9PLAN|nr:Epoxyqueuosine reductase [Stratiformator vulcanicus]